MFCISIFRQSFFLVITFLLAGHALADETLKQSLGERLFHDETLSKNQTQSCASCHNPQRAFIDTRVNETSINPDETAAVSTGQDGVSLGDINAPSLAYAALIPAFHFDAREGLYFGGLFLNGRAETLQAQAQQPFLNPLEMQMTLPELVSRVQEKYGALMQEIYGPELFSDPQAAFDAIADSIAAFERSEQFLAFNSRFDKVLRGEASFTTQEQLGHDLFVAEDKANCAACHPVPTLSSSPQESLFTDFSYDNLGVPENTLVREKNGKGPAYKDRGLLDHPQVDDPELEGAFRVSGLRNIALTAPYMHNGVFRRLDTVVQFYNTRDVPGALNPETGKPWREAEVTHTKNTEELGDLGLSDEEVTAIVAFLKTLTDASVSER